MRNTVNITARNNHKLKQDSPETLNNQHSDAVNRSQLIQPKISVTFHALTNLVAGVRTR